MMATLRFLRFTEKDKCAQSAYALVELLVSLLLGSLVAGIVCREVIFLSKNGYQLLKSSKERMTLATTLPIFEEIVDSIDSHRVNVPPRLQKGSLRFVDGSPISTSKNNKEESDAIYFVKAQRMPPLKVLEWQNQNGYITVKLCPFTKIELRDEAFDALAISVDGAYEVSVLVTDNAGGCAQGKIFPIKTIVTGIFSPLIRGGAIVPLEERKVFFIDSANNLRLLRFFKDAVIENQPLTSRLLSQQIKLSYPAPRLLSIEATLTLLSGKSWTGHFSSHLSRESPPLILFNL